MQVPKNRSAWAHAPVQSCSLHRSHSLTHASVQGTGLIEAFQLEDEVVACFLREIENGYLDNPYHSSQHAAGVLQMLHMLVQNGLIQSGVLDENLQLSCYMAGWRLSAAGFHA